MSYAGEVLIADLDSPAQLERFRNQVSSGSAIAELTGMVRVARLISSRILVTDAMLLDGTYFMSLGPEGVLQELGANRSDFPFVVTGTASTLRESLDSRLNNPNFTWSLPEMGNNQEPSQLLIARWNEWIRLVESGVIEYRVQVPTAEMKFARPPLTESSSQRIIEDLRDISRRSEAWAAIDESSLNDGEKQAVRSWWNSAYLQLIASNAGADWISFSANADQVANRSSNTLRVPKRLVSWARDSAPATVAIAWDTTANLRSTFERKPTWSSLRNLAFALTQTTQSSSRRMVIAESIVKIIVTGFVVLFALPDFEETAFYASFVWAIFGFVALTSLPYRAIKNLVVLMIPDPATLIVTFPRVQVPRTPVGAG